MDIRTTPLRSHLTIRRIMILVCVLVVLAAAGVSGWALAQRSASNYRVAVAQLGTVSATLQSTGTVEAVNSAQLSFQVGGQVANVAVGPGQQVAAGQVLATLDTSSLASAVDSAQSAVSDAQTKLTSDQASEASAASSAMTTTTVSPTSGQGGTSALSAAEATVSSDQRKTTADVTKEKADSAQASSQCATTAGGAQASATEPSPGTPGASGGGMGAPTTTTIPTSTTTTTTTTTSSTPLSCSAALHQVEIDQANISEDEEGVAQDEASLAKLESLTASSASSKGGSSTAASSSITPYDVDNDQASLDADEAQLSEAQVSLDEAELVSPISGTVASVAVTAGQTVGAGSSTAAITVLGPQEFEVSTTASVSNISELKLGDKVDVTLDGQSRPLKGSVIQVGPPPTSSSSTGYPVTVSLPGITSGLYDGGSATVSIIVGSASRVVTVPTSAVHLLASRTYVGEVRSGALQDVNVVIGVRGSTRTQVLAGLKVGDVVALANISQPLPSSSSTAGGAGAGVGSLTGGGGFRGGAGAGRSATTTTAGR